MILILLSVNVNSKIIIIYIITQYRYIGACKYKIFPNQPQSLPDLNLIDYQI